MLKKIKQGLFLIPMYSVLFLLKSLGAKRIQQLPTDSVILTFVVWLSRKALGKKNHYLTKNIKHIFPEYTEEEVANLEAEILRNKLLTVVDVVSLNPGSAKQLDIVGEQNIETVKEANGIIFITMHLNSWDFIDVALSSMGIESYLYYKDHSDELFDHMKINAKHRYRKGVNTKQTSKLVALMREGANVHMAADLKVKKGRNGQKLEFANQPAWTSTFVADMAITHNKAIIPTFVIRHKDGLNQCVFEAPVDLSSQDKNVVTQLINDAMSKRLIQYPANWALWDTNRWGP